MTINRFKKKRTIGYLISTAFILLSLFLFSIECETIGVAILVATILVTSSYMYKIAYSFKSKVFTEVYKKYDINYCCAKRKNICGNLNNITSEAFYSARFVKDIENRKYFSNDLLFGQRNGVKFKSVNVFCKHDGKEDNKKNEILFTGRVYEIDCKLLDTFILVIKESGNDKLEKIEFESIEANEKFNFFTNDKHQSFYYIKPDTLESILDIKASSTEDIILTIVNGKLYVGRDGYNPFTLNKHITQESIENSSEDEVKFIDKLVNLFRNKKAS